MTNTDTCTIWGPDKLSERPCDYSKPFPSNERTHQWTSVHSNHLGSWSIIFDWAKPPNRKPTSTPTRSQMTRLQNFSQRETAWITTRYSQPHLNYTLLSTSVNNRYLSWHNCRYHKSTHETTTRLWRNRQLRQSTTHFYWGWLSYDTWKGSVMHIDSLSMSGRMLLF